MRETITRKQFLLLGVGAAATALIPGCGDDGDTDTGGSTGSSDSESATASATDSTTASTTASTTNSTTASTTDTTTDSTSPTTDTSGDPGSSTGDDPTTDGSGSSGGQDSSGGSSSDGGSSSGGMAAGCDAAPTAMFDLHAHALNVPLADVMAGTAQDYVVGVMGHMHTVSVSAADFATLQESGQVVVMGSAGGVDNHTHMVTLTCA